MGNSQQSWGVDQATPGTALRALSASARNWASVS